MYESKYVKEWRKRTKQRLVEAFGGECGICKYDKCISALDFHHINPKEKDFSIAGSKIANWDTIVSEIRKCVCICCRCHREFHAGVIKIPKDIKRFNEKYATYKPQKVYDKCKCGESKPIFKKYCSNKCSIVGRRRVDWDKIDIQSMWLNGKTYEQIGSQVGVSGTTVRKWHIKQISG